LLPRGGRGDESLASFVRRRFGQEALERVVQPLVAGIYTADPEQLSLAATMPRFLEMERNHRSLILAMRAAQANAPAEASGARWSLFFNFDRGTQVLVDELALRLPPDAVHVGTSALALERGADAWRVVTTTGVFDADAVIVATPAHAA